MKRFKPQVKRQSHIAGVLNATEKRYADRLELLRLAGEIVSWRYEPRKFTIAYRCTYTPDFEVVVSGKPLIVEYHEVKGGFCRDDAIVKLKVTASRFCEYTFRLAKFKAGEWKIERVKTMFELPSPKPKKESK